MASKSTTKKAGVSTDTQNKAVVAKDIETVASKDSAKDPAVHKQKLVPSDVDPNQYVTVRNGFNGRLVYRSKKTGELFIWDEFGDEQEMELSELKNAKNSAKKFFINNWFMFDEAWIPEYLGLGNFYRYAVPIDEFDSLFEKSIEEVEHIVSNMSDGQKRSLSYRVRQLIADEKIDSNKMIGMLEQHLNTTLLER